MIFILNSVSVSWCFKKQAIIDFSSTEAKYVAMTLAMKEVTWLRLLLTKVGLLDKDNKYAEIKMTKSLGMKQIMANIARIKKEVLLRTLTSIATLTVPINPALTNFHLLISLFLKCNNQRFIALAHNHVFYP